MRTLRIAAVLAAFSCATSLTSVWAQSNAPTPPNPGAAPAAPAAPQAPATAATPAKQSDPVVAKVGDQEIHLSDLREALSGVPEQYRQLPQQMLFPMLLDQLIDRRAVAIYAEKQGLPNDPAVKLAMQRAAQAALENAAVRRAVEPQVTEEKVKAKYDQEFANKPGEEEVHARHILVKTEDEAKKIIDQLNQGGDFAAIAKAQSTDKAAAAQGGDLGWFKKGDMLPEFSAAAFALKPGQVSQTPVHTRYGWHVIKVEGTRTAPPPTYDEAKQEIRQQLIQEAVQNFVAQAKAGLPIEKFNMDGSKPAPTPAATPAPAPAAPAAQPK